ncbi:MAG: LolA family protein [Candidatus Cyclobacteriaceae bacterium M2_1C_046]
MKKFYFLAIVLLGVAVSSNAQYDKKALDKLEAMSAKYKNAGAYRSDFVYSLINDVENMQEDYEGTITVKGDKFILELDEQEIYNNGVTVWTYLPGINEVNIDNYNPVENEITPSKIYTAYKEGYKYIYLGEDKVDGESVSVIDLIPDDKDSQFFKIKLLISNKDNSLVGWTIFDKGGNKYRYRISDYTPNVKIEDKDFEFNPKNYPGVEVIDLR